MMSAVFVIRFSLAQAAIVPTVQRKVFSSGQEALQTMAAGVSGSQPPAISSEAADSSSPALKKRTIVAPCAAKERRLSRSGTGVRPAIRLDLGDSRFAFGMPLAPAGEKTVRERSLYD